MQAVPVILVHGFLASARLLLPMKWQLERQGYPVYLSNLSPLCIQDVRRLATELRDTVERVCFVEDVDHVDVVGVSLGGLVALYYQQSVAEQRRIRKLVAVGTPFLGTDFPRSFLPVLGPVSDGVWQVLPESDLLREMHDAGIPEGMELTAISMAGDQVSPPSSSAFPGARQVQLRGRSSPLTHQLLVASPTTLAAVTDVLETPSE